MEAVTAVRLGRGRARDGADVERLRTETTFDGANGADATL